MTEKRRIDVMLSSTFKDLVEHRNAVKQAMIGLMLHPLSQEEDAGKPDSDLIKASLDKVDAADAYVGIIGSRYGQRPICPTRNPNNLSLSELEYRRAVERDLPRCMFIMAGDHPLINADLKRAQSEGADSHAMLEAFIAMAKKDRIQSEFNSIPDLKSKATTTFVELLKILGSQDQALALPAPPADADLIVPAAPPALHFVRKAYVTRRTFVGRSAELAKLDAWSQSADTMLLFQAIGGMGKSMLTWHWLQNRADSARPDWAGKLWYSFYEQGADLKDFLVHALAYIRHQPPSNFRKWRTQELSAEVRRELDAKPWLLVMDGLERVLVAYNRPGKEHLPDEEAELSRDGLGLDRTPHCCYRPEDDDVLAVLAQARQGKILASSRLTPATLTADGQLLPSVQHRALAGLEPPDAELILRNQGVHGDSESMRAYLQEKFACHPLSIGVVAGHISKTFLEARGDFDRWAVHPKGGADPAIIAKDLRGRQNHILAVAFDALDNDQQALLGCLALTSIDLTPEIVRLLNPLRPPEPQPPVLPDEGAAWRPLLRSQDADIQNALAVFRSAHGASPARADAWSLLSAKLETTRRELEQQYDKDIAGFAGTHLAWQAAASKADTWLTEAIPEIEALGLMQYDASLGTLDLHPAVRHTAITRLSPDARGRACGHVSDALSSQPVKPFAEARSLDDLEIVMNRVKALCVAGQLEAAWSLYRRGLESTLSRLGYFHQELELLQAWLPQGPDGPIALPDDHHANVCCNAGSTYATSGAGSDVAIRLYQRGMKAYLEKANIEGAAHTARELAISYDDTARRSLAFRSILLGERIARANKSDTEAWCQISKAIFQIDSGQLAEAADLLNSIPVERLESDEDLKPFIERAKLELDWRNGHLTEEKSAQAIDDARKAGVRIVELYCCHIRARWRQQNNDHAGAIEGLNEVITLANEIRHRYLPVYQARRAVSLAATGNIPAALRTASEIERRRDPPHVPLAQLYLALGDTQKARAHAEQGYKLSWGDGPPFSRHWNVEECRQVLAAVGAPEPTLPPFDPSTIKPFPFEADIERLIETTFAEREARIQRLSSKVGVIARMIEPSRSGAAGPEHQEENAAPAEDPPATPPESSASPPQPDEMVTASSLSAPSPRRRRWKWVALPAALAALVLAGLQNPEVVDTLWQNFQAGQITP